MTEELILLVKSLSSGYMMRQTVVITVLYLAGLLFTSAFYRDRDAVIWRILLAFPSGLALFAVSSELMLSLGIPFNAFTSAGALIVISAFAGWILLKNNNEVDINFKRRSLIIRIVSVVIVFLIGIMLTSNVMKVALDNDSLYYFSAYPDAIVQEGRYIKYFDVFLTDAAPIGSIIQTLPYLFGFSETFAIQYFMDLDLLLIFGYAIFSESKQVTGVREAGILSGASVLFLFTSSAYLTTAKWIMSGVYFMSYYFILAYMGYRAAVSCRENKPYPLLILMAVMTAMIRHEGALLVLVLILTLSSLEGYTGKELSQTYILPVFTAALLYYVRVFLILAVHPLYAFLTPAKACVILGLLLMTGVFFLLLRDPLMGRIGGRMLVIMPVLLLAVNLGICLIRPGTYLGNIRMFCLNVRIGAGWGYFGYIAAVALLILVIKALIRHEKRLLFFDSLMFTYVLSVLIVSFGRGDSLRKGVGDSGNRVMLTAVPLIVFAMILRCFLSDAGEEMHD